MNMGHWILDENKKVISADLMTWARWFEKSQRVVKQEHVGKLWVSTVFLGLDHNLSNEGPPILWETMVFHSKGDGSDIDMDRCAGTWEQAEAMHAAMVKRLREKL